MGTIELIVLPLCIAVGFAVTAGWLFSIRAGYLGRIGPGVPVFRRVTSMLVPVGMTGLTVVCLFTGMFFLVTG